MGTPMLLIKFELNWIIVFKGDVQNMNSQHCSHIKCMGNQIWSCRKKVKRQRRTIILSILVDLPSPMICAKVRPQCLFWLWTRRLLKILQYEGMAAIICQRIVTIVAIFCSPAPRRFHMKYEQHWPGGFRGEVVWNSQHFATTNVWGPYKWIGKQTWLHRKKVKRQCTTIILATLVDLPSPMICAKFQPQSILGSGEENVI